MADYAKEAVLQRRQLVEDVKRYTAAATIDPSETKVIGDTTAAAMTLTLPSPESCAGRTYLIEAPEGNSQDTLTVAFTGNAPDGSQAITIDDGYVVAHSFGHIWIVLASDLT